MAGACFVLLDVFLVLIAVFLPPVPVFIKAGLCSADTLINIALCFLGYVPGVIHSWYIIAKYPETVEVDIERQDDSRAYFARPVYIAVGHGDHGHGHGHGHQCHTGANNNNGTSRPGSAIPDTYSDEGRRLTSDHRLSHEYGTLPQGPPPDYKQ